MQSFSCELEWLMQEFGPRIAAPAVMCYKVPYELGLDVASIMVGARLVVSLKRFLQLGFSALFATTLFICDIAWAQGVELSREFGSRVVLEAIWTDTQLQHLDGENLVSGYHQPDVTLPDGGCAPLHTMWAASSRPGNIRSVSPRSGVGKVVALTFDFCELSTKTSGYNGEVIDFLRQHSIPATLFLGGKWMKTHQERAMQLIADPLFEIGSHAWTHGNFALLPEKEAVEQVMCTEKQYEILRDAIAERLGSDDRYHGELAKIPESMSLFRLPYGRVTRENLDFLHKIGVGVIQWDVVVPEWELISDKFVSSNMNIRSGSILLMHATSVPPHTLENLKTVVGFLRKEGYDFVTVTRLLGAGSPNVYTEGYFRNAGDNIFLDSKYAHYGTAHLPPEPRSPAN
ncbi:polysaccharide deacetylase family protein [Anaplasma capra]|uniref:polysaccharide deacetylase family protein n=1 Tax=Anaplasma capra TaxID=1562740 RepID=UPI0021D57495|nr:polysaccharide deacetylase family protein [Anaplasma capra]MCU7612544.1 polysaccharide deacetylase family protein [Anaplasma capra]